MNDKELLSIIKSERLDLLTHPPDILLYYKWHTKGFVTEEYAKFLAKNYTWVIQDSGAQYNDQNPLYTLYLKITEENFEVVRNCIESVYNGELSCESIEKRADFHKDGPNLYYGVDCGMYSIGGKTKLLIDELDITNLNLNQYLISDYKLGPNILGFKCDLDECPKIETVDEDNNSYLDYLIPNKLRKECEKRFAQISSILNGGFHYYGAYGQNDPVTGIIGEDELKSLKENENSVYHENP